MASYKLEFKPSLEKDLAAIPSFIRENIWRRILGLAQNPRPPQSIKLKNTHFSWRLRVGDYRVLYQIDDGSRIVEVVAVKHRREAYR